MPIAYDWSRTRVCETCGETFTTMAGNIKSCAPCRYTEQAKQERLERKRRHERMWKKLRKQREKRPA